MAVDGRTSRGCGRGAPPVGGPPRVRSAALALVVAVLVAACGGSSETADGEDAAAAPRPVDGAVAPSPGPPATPATPAAPATDDDAVTPETTPDAATPDDGGGGVRPLAPGTDAAAGGGGPPGGAFEIVADDFFFSPATVPAGGARPATVSVRNEGSIPHTFTVDELGVDELIQPGAVADVQLDLDEAAGLDYYCRFHPTGMRGTFTRA